MSPRGIKQRRMKRKKMKKNKMFSKIIYMSKHIPTLVKTGSSRWVDSRQNTTVSPTNVVNIRIESRTFAISSGARAQHSFDFFDCVQVIRALHLSLSLFPPNFHFNWKVSCSPTFLTAFLHFSNFRTDSCQCVLSIDCDSRFISY